MSIMGASKVEALLFSVTHLAGFLEEVHVVVVDGNRTLTTGMARVPPTLESAFLAGEEIHVVAVGGSVTTGMGAARPEDAYLSLVVAWLRSLGEEAHPVRVEVQPLGPCRYSN